MTGQQAIRNTRSNFKKTKNSKKRKTILLIALLGITVVLAFIGVGLIYANNMIDKVDYEETKNAQWDIDDKVAENQKDYRQIAILGVDARTMTNYDGSRSDAILVLSIHKQTGEIKMISVMRDTYLEIYNREGELYFDKITNAHAIGGGVDTCRSLNRNLDLSIREYAIFNWKAVADTVDALGGVTVEVKQNELYDLNKYGQQTGEVVGRPFNAVTSAGVQDLDGIQAASYCRIRKTSGGDSQRAERLKKVMEALFVEAKKMNLTELNEIADNVLPEIRTNMNNSAIFGLMADLGKYKLNGSIGLPYEYKGGMFHGGWYAVPRTLETNVVQLHQAAFGLAEYQVSDTVLDISKRIQEDTGVVPE
jgi:polyisoprenyl-teichoic acid--peptidoglycan teichoic acid transferase